MDVQKTENAVGGEFFFSTETFGICDVSPAMLAALKGESGPEKRIEAKREILRHLKAAGNVPFCDLEEMFLKERGARVFSLSPRDYVTPGSVEEWSENLGLFNSGTLSNHRMEKVWFQLRQTAEKEFASCGKSKEDRQHFASCYGRALESFFAAFEDAYDINVTLRMIFPEVDFEVPPAKVEKNLGRCRYDKDTFEAVMLPMMGKIRDLGKATYSEAYIYRKMAEVCIQWGEGMQEWERKMCEALSKHADPFKITAAADPSEILNFQFLRWYLQKEKELTGQSDLRNWMRRAIRTIGSVRETQESLLFESYDQYAKLLECGFKEEDFEEEYKILLSDLEEFVASVILMPEAATPLMARLLTEAATAVILATRDEFEEIINSPENIDPSEALEKLRACMKVKIWAELHPLLTVSTHPDAFAHAAGSVF